MSRVSFPMTTATGMGPLPELLEDAAGLRGVYRTFEAAGLPLHLLEDRNQKIPMAAMITLFNEAEKTVGDELFGLCVGQEMKPGAYGLWTRYSGQGETAEDALVRLCKTISVHQSGGSMNVTHHGAQAVWTYSNPPGQNDIQRAHADHVIPVMIGFLSPFLGRDWVPEQIGVPFSNDGRRERRTDLFPCEWRYNKAGVSLSFPSELLKKSRPGLSTDPVLTSVELYAERLLRDARSPECALKELIALRLLDGKVDISGAARLTGQSLRTFQRNLDRDGLTYSSLLTSVRMERAVALLRETKVSVTDISLQLGFSDPANFARAFRGWTGRSPSSFRRESKDM